MVAGSQAPPRDEGRRAANIFPSLRSSSSSTPRNPPQQSYGDRFIPNRSAMDMEFAQLSLTCSKLGKEKGRSKLMKENGRKETYKKLLAETLFGDRTRILEFRSKPPLLPCDDFSPKASSINTSLAKSKEQRRCISQSAERTLYAPNLVDDFSLNLLDWGNTNVLSVALGRTVYLRNASNGCLLELVTFGEDNGPVTSISWAPDGQHLAIGLNNSDVQLWDVGTSRRLRTLRGIHRSRVGSLAWNNHILTTGGMDSKIVNNDIRVVDHALHTYQGHTREVCGLRWSCSGLQLASGGVENLVRIWDLSMASTTHAPGQKQWVHEFRGHNGPVRALAWCPFQRNLLASGGGSGDRCIKFWKTDTGACLNSVNTGSQVCALLWNKNERELLSSHGYTLSGQLTLWKYPSMSKMVELTGHDMRALFLTQSPDGHTVASAGDDRLNFWNVFRAPKVEEKASPFSSYGQIR